jgi:small subunit ribosomal protein S15
MSITTQKRTELIETYRRAESDTGSPQIQVAVLTERITSLTDHLRSHKHDFSSRRGLLAMVSRRNRLLKYLARTERPAYLELIKQVGLRK